MAKKERETVNLKRVWVRITPEAHKALLHLAIDLDATVEKLAGELMAVAIERAQDEMDAKADPKKHKG